MERIGEGIVYKNEIKKKILSVITNWVSWVLLHWSNTFGNILCKLAKITYSYENFFMSLWIFKT